jgi:hypothetical protein
MFKKNQNVYLIRHWDCGTFYIVSAKVIEYSNKRMTLVNRETNEEIGRHFYNAREQIHNGLVVNDNEDLLRIALTHAQDFVKRNNMNEVPKILYNDLIFKSFSDILGSVVMKG